ncbi:MAG: cadherin-like beta sandwich domain-containing protein [Hominenteromicrobium sp.]
MQKPRIHYLLYAVIWLVFCLASGLCVSAEETADIFRIVHAPEAIRRGSSFSVVLSPAQSSLSAFVLFAEYDPADIVQAKAVFSDGFQNAYVYTSAQTGRLAVVCTAKNGSSLPKDGTLTLTFQSSADSLSGSVPVHIVVTDAAATDAAALLDAPAGLEITVPFTPNPSSDSSLLTLVPPIGTLSPAFDPEVFDYKLDVPFSSASLIFETVPADGASVRVNRKNLGAGGSTVDFSFTVTAEDGVTKSVYTVSVTRLAKAGTSAGTGAGASSAASGETTDSPAAAGGASDADSSSGGALSAASDTVYMAANAVPYDARADRFETMAIVLISVGAGMGFVLLFQRFGKTRHPDDRDK